MANIDSLIPSNTNYLSYKKIPVKYLNEFSTLIWKRVDEIYKGDTLKLFLTPNLGCEDVRQNSLGSCYFLSAVSGLLKHNFDRFKKLFSIQQFNPKGEYGVILYYQGEPIELILDDFIPCIISNENDFKPAFAFSRVNELAILILEKAWAKLNNSCYLKTWQGTPQEALAALCEAPCVFEYTKKNLEKNKINFLWEKLMDANNKKWILCANTEGIHDEIGLDEFHSFTILDVYEINPNATHNHKVISHTDHNINISNNGDSEMFFNKESNTHLGKNYSELLRFIKMRTPRYDCSKFKGLFHEDSDLWTDELKNDVNFNQEFKAGTFLVTFEEFAKYFVWTFICKYEHSYSYRYKKYKIECQHVNDDNLAEETEFNRSNNTYKKILNINIISDIKETAKFHNHNGDEDHNNTNEEIPTPQLDYNLSPSKESVAQTLLDINLTSKELKTLNSKNNNKINELITALLNIPEETKCYITLHQPQARFNDKTPLEELKIPLAFIIISKYDPISKSYTYINSEFINWEKLTVECHLLPGEYHIFAKSYCTSDNNQYELVLSTYGECPCELLDLSIDSIPLNWLEKIMIDIAKNNQNKDYLPIAVDLDHVQLELNNIQNQTEKDLTVFSSNVVFSNHYSGFAVFYYENNSIQSDLIVKINFDNTEGIKFLNYEFNDTKCVFITISPKDYGVIIMEIHQPPWACYIEYKQEIWLEYPVELIINYYFKKEDYNRIISDEGVIIDEIKHDRGYVLVIDNVTKIAYQGEFSFYNMKDYKIDNYLDLHNVLFKLGAGTKKILQVKGIKRALDPYFNLNYKFNFTEYEAIQILFQQFKNQNQLKINLIN